MDEPHRTIYDLNRYFNLNADEIIKVIEHVKQIPIEDILPLNRTKGNLENSRQMNKISADRITYQSNPVDTVKMLPVLSIDDVIEVLKSIEGRDDVADSSNNIFAIDNDQTGQRAAENKILDDELIINEPVDFTADDSKVSKESRFKHVITPQETSQKVEHEVSSYGIELPQYDVYQTEIEKSVANYSELPDNRENEIKVWTKLKRPATDTDNERCDLLGHKSNHKDRNSPAFSFQSLQVKSSSRGLGEHSGHDHQYPKDISCRIDCAQSTSFTDQGEMKSIRLKKCTYCHKQFNEHYLKVHERVHTGHKPFECMTCHKCFTRRSTLTSHERIHTGHKPYECMICQKCFREKSLLKRHERIHTTRNVFSA